MRRLPRPCGSAALCLAAFGLALLCPAVALAQALPSITVNFGQGGGSSPQLVPALKALLLLTVLTLAPAILVSMTSFTRIVIVLSFVRQALGTQNVPPMQVVLALSLLFTGVVMTPVATRWQREALAPYESGQIGDSELWQRSSTIARSFLLPQTRQDDLSLFYEMTRTAKPQKPNDVELRLLVPAFMISELRTGFEMGFLLFLPFVLIDLVVAAILTAMGMIMMPPTMLSMPLKLLLFVLVDGWSLLARSLMSSFGGAG